MKLLVECPKCHRFHRIEVKNGAKLKDSDAVCWYCKKGIPIQPRRKE